LAGAGLLYLLKGGTQTLIVSLYPIIFWTVLLKLNDELKPIPISIENNSILQKAWTVYFYIGILNLVFVLLVTVRLSLGITSAYRSVPGRTEVLVRDLLKNPSTENELAVKSQIRDLLRKTLAGGQLRIFSLASAGRQVRSRVFVLAATFLLIGLGSYIVAIAIVRWLSPLLPQILPFEGFNLGFPLALGAALVLASAVGINYFIEKNGRRLTKLFVDPIIP